MVIGSLVYTFQTVDDGIININLWSIVDFVLYNIDGTIGYRIIVSPAQLIEKAVAG